MATDVHQVITDKIVAALEGNEAGEWSCPWHRTGSGLPTNFVTGKPYHGINTLSLWLAAAANGYAEQRWATYRQWASLGAQVRRGQTGSLVVFYKELAQDRSEQAANDNARRFVAKGSFVFNIAQVTGVKRVDQLPQGGFDPIAQADRFIVASGIPIEHTGDHACYIPSRDLVRLPPCERFRSSDAYYSTAFHELAHATGHKSRLDRDLTGRFGGGAYAMEELVAEISSAFVMAGLGLSPEPHPELIAYLATWIKVLRGDKRAIFTAASAASKAANYLTQAAVGARSTPADISPDEEPRTSSPEPAQPP